MGDPFSIAVGALQVAEVGFKLCDTLHSSVRDFKNAEKDVKRVASEVKTASGALKQLGVLLQQDEAIKRTKPGAISEASTALNQCSEAFAEVQIMLPAAGSGSTTSIPAATRFKWATRKSKVDSLLANLERLKTTLVFKVISYAKEIACSSKDTATDHMDMRFQLETLIKSKDEAVRRYEELARSLNQTCLDDDSTNAFGPDSGSQSLNAGLNLMAPPSNHAAPTQGNTNVKRTASGADTGDKNRENHDLSKCLTEALADCRKAASGLSECLHIVHIQWRAVQKYDGDDIWKNYRLTNEAMRALEVVQALSPKATPSLTVQLQAPQQQAQEQVEPNEQQTVQPMVSKLSSAQVQGQETFSRSETIPLLTAASSEGKKKLTEPPEMVTRSYSDHWPLSASSGPAPRSRPPSRSPSPARGRNGSLGNRVRSSSGASDQRDYILDLANPERAPSNDNSERVQKHPATFQCHLCPKRFTRAYNLRCHLRTHTDERPFSCKVCGKAFARQHDKQRHEGLHSREDKFVCKGNLGSGAVWGCGERFARADALYRHFCSEAGRVCIGPPQEEEERAYRQRLEEEDATTQTRPHTGGLGLDTGIGEVEKASLKTDRELPGISQVLLQQYPALARIHFSALNTPLSPIKDEAKDHDAETGNGIDKGRSSKLPQAESVDPQKLLSGDVGEPSTASYRRTDGNVSVSTADVPSANDGETSGSSCDSPEEGPHLPPRPRVQAMRRPASVKRKPRSHLPRKEDVDLKLTQFSYEKPQDFEKPIDADTEDPVDVLLREWTTIRVC